MRVLVMGGNRYIGLCLVEELVRQGHEVTAMNSHAVPYPAGVRRLHGDRQQPGAIEEVLGPHRDEFDAVFDNTAYVPADLEPMIGLFTGRVQHFVFTSSVAVYRRSFVQPVNEDARRHDPADPDPRKAYGVGKVQCEDRLDELHASTGLPHTTLRVGHTFGPRSPLVTRDPLFFRRMELGRPTLVPGEGFAALCLVHVTDVARAMVSVLGNERAVGRTYNIVGREFAGLLGVLEMIGRAVGVKPNIVHVPLHVARSLHPPLVHWGEAITGSTVYDIERACTELAWEPRFGLESGYADSYRWYSDVGRDMYQYDFAAEDALLERFGRGA
jgi:nucleoside-diphosphate-sugar epimerase